MVEMPSGEIGALVRLPVNQDLGIRPMSQNPVYEE
jgi:hypothetical protein